MKFFILATREITALIWLYNMMDITGILRGASELKCKWKRRTGYPEHGLARYWMTFLRVEELARNWKAKDCDKTENWGDFLSAI